MLIDISNLKFIKDVYGIIHIGAHECEERMKYLLHFNNITDNEIIWIEALNEKVTQITEKYPSILIFNECISNVDNEIVTFNVTNNFQSSSILNLKEHLIEHPDIYEIQKIEMKTKTLKTFYDDNHFHYDQFNFMALDIQGAELLALQGAREILDFIDYIYIEVNTKELYENCALMCDIDNYLSTFNFTKQTLYMTEHGWGDAFYVKSKFNIPSYKIEYGLEQNKIDITNIVLKNTNPHGIYHIPQNDNLRSTLFGDPIFGKVKNIYISCENNNFIIDHNDYVNIDTIHNTIYINEEIIEKTIQPNFTLCVMSIFKNETMNLKIWIEHYIWQGVEHFYLIDNGSDDSPLDILQEYIDKQIVTYFYRPERYKQPEHYRDIFDLENLKEKTKWLCICDLDEFFFGTEQKLSNSIEEFNNYDVIYTNSFFYGSDNLIEHPKDIRTAIVHRDLDIVNGIKYIFKPSSINNSSEIWIHWLVDTGTLQKKNMNEIIQNNKIRLNHYHIQSLEYFTKVKMTRGDVSVVANENIRNMDHFNKCVETSVIKDTILKQIIENGY